ncbi:hypothetical protein SHIRM173S_04587 [Streptomyces hirsutus]
MVLVGAALYLCAGLASLRIAKELLGPDRALVRPGWPRRSPAPPRPAAGLRHLAAPSRREAAWALAAMSLMRFCYGAMLVMLLMLCRYALTDTTEEGLALLGLALGVSGAGFFVAAVVTPWAAGRFGPGRWIMLCAAAAAVLEPVFGLPFASGPLLIGAFVLGLTTQGAKIATDTIVQSTVDDAFRGRIFSLYDVLFNVAFVVPPQWRP